MKDRDFPFLPLLLLGAMVYGAYWLYKNIELVEEEFTVNESIEAIQNPHLAASRLLGTEGFKPSLALDRGMFRSLDIASVGVLWLYSLDVLLDDREVARVRRWVESGGILLASPAGLISDSIPPHTACFWKQLALSRWSKTMHQRHHPLIQKTKTITQRFCNYPILHSLKNHCLYRQPITPISNLIYQKQKATSAIS